MSGKVAYIMSRFPHLPETFILREMNELIRQGWDIALYPLIQQKQAVLHPEAEPLFSRLRPLPFFSWSIIKANARTAVQQPETYANIWLRTLKETIRSPYMLVRAVSLLPRAVYAAELMSAEGVSHIHAHYATYPAYLAWVINQVSGIDYSITVHAHDIFVNQSMLKTKLDDAAFIAAISNYNREYVAAVAGSPIKEKTHIVHCGIEPDLYENSPRSRAPGEYMEIIHVGSLQPYKGQRYLVEACNHLRNRGIPFRCQIIGEGEERASLTRLIRELGLESAVLLLGAKTQQEVAQLLTQAHCYVQPSIVTPSGKMEGIPVALMEAMASSLPVVATSISGVPELVQPGETGYLVPPADTVALADALATVYQQPNYAARLAANGRALVQESFALEPNVTNLAELFKDIMQREKVPKESVPLTSPLRWRPVKTFASDSVQRMYSLKNNAVTLVKRTGMMNQLQPYLQQLESYLNLKRNWWLLALTVGIALVVSLAFMLTSTPSYQTSARFIVSPNVLESDRDAINSLEALDRRSVVATYAEVLQSNRIFSAAQDGLDVEPGELEGYEVTAVVLPEASVLELMVKGPDPEMTAQLANSMGEEAIAYVSALYPIHQFNFLDEAPVPETAAGPPALQNVIISVILGLGLGVMLIILRERTPTQLFLNNSSANWETARRNEQIVVTNGAVHHDIESATSPSNER